MRLTQANIYCEKRTLEREKQSGNKFELEFFCKSCSKLLKKLINRLAINLYLYKMALKECIYRLNEYIKQAHTLDKESLEQIVTYINICNDRFAKAFEANNDDAHKKVSLKEHKCLKCNESNPTLFNRKKTECTPCMSKAGYEKIKVKLDQGKERNIIARLSRGKCTVCSLTVVRENAQMFDWDHRDPSDKLYGISRMNYKTDELFITEIAKCDLTCRNCHMMRTMQQHKDNTIPKRNSKRI